MVGGPDNGDPADGPLAVRLSSPWDVAWWPQRRQVAVAMAGNHTLWAFDPVASSIIHLAGTMNEGLVDGPPGDAWFAQPSGFAVDAHRGVWIADAETSSLRVYADAGVQTAIGQGLFDFGHRDGRADAALLQHPLGVALLPDGSVAIADTYNGSVRRYVPPVGVEGAGEVTTLARDLAEPSGLVVEAHDDGALDLLVVESAAHRITRLRLPDRLVGQMLDVGAHRTQRPVTDISPGEVTLEVVFTPATGQKYDDRFGPSTRLQVFSTPPGLLLDGAGDAVPLTRTLRVNPAVGEGVLHVTAQAASCDADPTIEFPACHLNAQDWGVPVRVAHGATERLALPLHG